jgi:hypothetical protein
LPKSTWAIAILIAVLAFQSMLFAQATPTWTTQGVDDSGSHGSIAYDSSGNPHIAYSKWYTVNTEYGDSSTYALSYAVKTGANWTTQTIDPSGGGGLLALDSMNRPHIIYNSQEGLKYAFLDGQNWAIQTIDSFSGYYSMALDSNGNPHVVYGLQTIKYAVLNGSKWDIQTVDSVNSTVTYRSPPSIALDSNNQPHIIYLDAVEFPKPIITIYEPIYQTYNVKYASLTGQNWLIQTVTTNSTAIGNLVLDQNGKPSFCYNHETFNYLENGSIAVDGSANYAYWNNGAWSSRIIDSNPTPSGQTYLKLDSVGNPQVYYFVKSSENKGASIIVMSANWVDQRWVIADVGSFQINPSYYPGMVNVGDFAFDSFGNPSVAVDGEIGTLRSAPVYGALTYASFENSQASTDYLIIIIPVAVVVTVILTVAVIIIKKKGHLI